MELAAKPCLECGEPVGKGRVDRKFCSVECKNKHHNKEAFADKMSTEKIKKILNKNRKILKAMYGRKDNDEIEKERLLKAGFEFEYAHFKKTKMGNYTYTFCFDYGYREVKDWKDKKDRLKVVKAFIEKED
jgi:hypothetical protein